MVRTSVKHTRFATTIARLWRNTVEATPNVTELSRRTPHPTPSAQQECDHVRVCRGPKQLLLSWHSTCTQYNTSRDVSTQAVHLTRSKLFSCAPHLNSSADALHCDETPNGTKARHVVWTKKLGACREEAASSQNATAYAVHARDKKKWLGSWQCTSQTTQYPVAQLS